MRCFVLLLFLLLLVPYAHAQETVHPTAIKYWIFFDSKPQTVSSPASERTLDRRATRAAVETTFFDADLDSTYLWHLEQLGIVPQVRSRWLNAVSAPLTPAQVESLRATSFVQRLTPVGRAIPTHEATYAPSPVLPASSSLLSEKAATSYGFSETQLALMNAIAPLERGIDGSGVRIGFLDTEYDSLQHRAFQRLRDEGRFIGIRNFAQGPQGSRHGLAVVSTAVGYDPGILVGPAHGAEVLVATTEYAPTETNQEEDQLVAGLEWLEANGADVVNISLGYTTFDVGEHSYTPDDLDGNTAVTTRAVDIAVGLGMVVVTSAGNEASCGSPQNCWYFIGTPADADSVIAVGAVRADSSRASFSSFGPTADGRIKPDMAAMGQQVYLATSGDGYAFSNGTSFSSPLTAAVAAQMLQVNPSLTPLDVRAILRATASQATNPDNALGWGIINADAAVIMAETGINPIGVSNETVQPLSFTVGEPYPNPFASSTTLTIASTENLSPIRISIYSLKGERLTIPFEGPVYAGQNHLRLHIPDLPSGLYFYRVESTSVLHTGKLFVVK